MGALAVRMQRTASPILTRAKGFAGYSPSANFGVIFEARLLKTTHYGSFHL